MKKNYSQKMYLTLFLVAFSFSATMAAQVDLANWTFTQSQGTSVPTGYFDNKPIPANSGVRAATAELGADWMFTDGEQTSTRLWTYRIEYVRVAGTKVNDYFRIKGVSTVGYTTIKVSASFNGEVAAAGSAFFLQLQYRLTATGTWMSQGVPVLVSTNSSTMPWSTPRHFDNVELPAECNGAAEFEVRFLLTSLDATTVPVTTTAVQVRMDNIVITGDNGTAGVNDLNANPFKVSASTNAVVINGVGAQAKTAYLYAINGALYKSVILTADRTEIPTNKGLYFVKIGEYATKVLVK